MICLKLHFYFRDRVHSIQELRNIFMKNMLEVAKYLKAHQKHPDLM